MRKNKLDFPAVDATKANLILNKKRVCMFFSFDFRFRAILLDINLYAK